MITEIPQVPRYCNQLNLKKHRINVGDCELYCDEQGKGITVVLLHGGPGATHHYFHPHFSRAKKFARIIYYDQRGCGISDHKRSERYSVEQAADDLESLRYLLKAWQDSLLELQSDFTLEELSEVDQALSTLIVCLQEANHRSG